MFLSFPKPPQSFALKLSVAALLAASVASAQAAPSCNGRAATQHITSLSQLRFIPNTGAVDVYELLGTTASDTLVIEIPAQAQNILVSIDVKLAEPGTAGGYDYVCVNSDIEFMDVSGAKYLKSQGVGYVGTSKLRDSAYVEIEGAANIRTGNGDNTVTIDDSQNSAHSTTQVHTGSGNDSVLITTQVSALVDLGAGDDRVNIELLTRDDGLSVPAAINAGDGDDTVSIVRGISAARAFVVGGKGKDFIVTGDGSDLVYGSDVSYSGNSFESLNIVNFNEAAIAFMRSNANELRSQLTPIYSADTSGSLIDTGGGNDYIYGTNGVDDVSGGSGKDYLKGYGGRDRLAGDSGNDKLYGGDDNDALDGGSGSDTCSGDAGTDTTANCEL